MTADILRDLARAKAVFQLRAIETIIRGPASVDRSPKGGDGEAGSIEDESAVPKADAQTLAPSSQEQSQ